MRAHRVRQAGMSAAIFLASWIAAPARAQDAAPLTQYSLPPYLLVVGFVFGLLPGVLQLITDRPFAMRS